MYVQAVAVCFAGLVTVAWFPVGLVAGVHVFCVYVCVKQFENL